MEEHEERLIAQYIGLDEELRRYVEEHRRLKRDVEMFNGRIHLTSEEEVRKKLLQKQKLIAKEAIIGLLRKYHHEMPTP
jgi:hypothetical protein